jgi:hypothetical protein
VRTVAAGAVLLLVAVAGCSADEAGPAEVGPLASGSRTAAVEGAASSDPAVLASASQSAGEPSPADEVPLPAAATAEDALGASAFAKHYMLVLQKALESSDASNFESLSDPGCGGCRNIIDAIGQASQAGQRVSGAELSVVFAEAPAVRGGETIVDLRYERRSGRLLSRDGAVVEAIPPEGPIDTQLRVRRQGEAWVVLGLRQAPT